MPIVGAMSTPLNTELDLELARLESRVDELAARVIQLQEENRALRQRHDTLSTERASLLNKNEQVRGRVEAMIGRLKTLEHA
jgi:cell division protein ZapB